MRRMLNTTVMLCAWSALLATLLVPTASATWGHKCSAGNGHHCYGIAEWAMSGSGNGGGEELKGISGEIATDLMSVPLWEDGDVVTDEMWLDAPESEGGWAEDGQLAGEDLGTEEGHEVNGTSIHPFYAYEPNNGEGAFQIYVYPGTVEVGSWQSYSEEDTYTNGYWCAGFGFGTAACKAGYPAFATDVQVGMEAGDERQPESTGQDHIISQYTNGTWHVWSSGRTHYLSEDYSGESEAGYVCAANYGGLSPGYTQWGTPSSAHPC
jgi:uncharacterized membrane protein